MNLKDIQELIKFVAKSGATEVDLEIDNIKISIKSPAKKRRGAEEEVKTIVQQIPQQIVTQQTTRPEAVSIPITEKSTTELLSNTKQEDSTDETNYITIKASMIGTFYRSSSPETPPFVSVGDSIKEGDTICIIEAMKLFNEIESEISGKIIKVLVDDTTPIEFDQPLFLVDPS
jgi:acetyl-CoA carboxylase biotin carboxyl carrier protein